MNQVTVILDDGRTFEGDVLVGADGIWSKVSQLNMLFFKLLVIHYVDDVLITFRCAQNFLEHKKLYIQIILVTAD